MPGRQHASAHAPAFSAEQPPHHPATGVAHGHWPRCGRRGERCARSRTASGPAPFLRGIRGMDLSVSPTATGS
eukprot:3575353-Alexandrium_andersonii.AAC.1